MKLEELQVYALAEYKSFIDEVNIIGIKLNNYTNTIGKAQ
jgi:hypothetical protein